MKISTMEGRTEIRGSGFVARSTRAENFSGISGRESLMVATSTHCTPGEEEEKVKFHDRGWKSSPTVERGTQTEVAVRA